MSEVVSEEHRRAAAKLRDLLATYREAKDLIDVGAYKKGSNPKIDMAIEMIDEVNSFLRQGIFEKAPFDQTISRLVEMASRVI
jgi:flagellum-specific ATP synthase